jgi:hypothetical protein
LYDGTSTSFGSPRTREKLKMNSLRKYFVEVMQSGNVRSSNGGWFGCTGGVLRVRILPQSDWRGITKRDTVGNEINAFVSNPGEGNIEGVEPERSVVLRMASSGT